jgi:hypothetical protein
MLSKIGRFVSQLPQALFESPLYVDLLPFVRQKNSKYLQQTLIECLDVEPRLSSLFLTNKHDTAICTPAGAREDSVSDAELASWIMPEELSASRKRITQG